MSHEVAKSLASTGVAQVIAVLKPRHPLREATLPGAVLKLCPRSLTRASRVSTRAPASAVPGLSKHFLRSEMSQDSAILAAAEPEATDPGRRVSRRFPSPPPMRFYPNLGVVLGTVDPAGLAALERDVHVERVLGAPALLPIRPERVAAARLTRKVTWGIQRLGIPKLWKEGLSGKGVLVGHLDTGIDGQHPALRRAVSHFAEFDAYGFEVDPAPRPHDAGDHGTHTAGTIAGRPVRGRTIGIAPQAELASAIVIEGGNVVARVLGGMDWALGLNVRILNMSLGFPGYVADFLALTQILRQRGVLPVFAVGNEGPGTSRSPGNYAEALSVGAIDRNDQVVWFSSSHRFRRADDPVVPDLVAPGAGVISAAPGGRYQAMDGTSMATPHVSGLAALLLEAKPGATAGDVEEAIFSSCRLDGLSPSRAGRGIPDGLEALRALERGTGPKRPPARKQKPSAKGAVPRKRRTR